MTDDTERSNKQSEKIMPEFELSELHKYVDEIINRNPKVILSAFEKERIKAFTLLKSGEITKKQKLQLDQLLRLLGPVLSSAQSTRCNLDLLLDFQRYMFCEDN